MAGSIYDWSLTPATNATADGDINWQEFQDPATVNNSARQMMGRLAEFRRDIAPFRTSTGSSNAYAVTSSSSPVSLVDGTIVYFYADKTNSGAATLALNAFATYPLRAKTGIELKNGEIQVGSVIGAYFRSASNEWIVINSGVHVGILGPQYVTGSVFGINVGDVKLSLKPSADPGFIRLTETSQSLLKASYPELNAWASAMGYPWGSTTNNFSIPGAGGYFLRFGASNATVDPDGARIAGSFQTDLIKQHTHSGSTSSNGDHTHTDTKRQSTSGIGGGGGTGFLVDLTSNNSQIAQSTPTTSSTSGAHTHTFTTDNGTGTGTETRPKSVTMYADILALPTVVASQLIGVGGFAFQWDAGTANADPGAGYIRVNNAAVASATALYISETDYFGGSLAGLLQSITPNSILQIVKLGNPAVFATFTLTTTATDNGTYDTFSLTYRSGPGGFAQGDRLAVVVMPAGPTATLATYTVAALPALAAGSIAYASNGRKNGEGAAAGTGVLVFRDASAWRACDTGSTVLA